MTEVAEVVVVVMPAVGRSGRGRQRHRTEGSGGNESESKFTKHGRSP
jgi:hypothetical protein